MSPGSATVVSVNGAPTASAEYTGRDRGAIRLDAPQSPRGPRSDGAITLDESASFSRHRTSATMASRQSRFREWQTGPRSFSLNRCRADAADELSSARQADRFERTRTSAPAHESLEGQVPSAGALRPPWRTLPLDDYRRWGARCTSGRSRNPRGRAHTGTRTGQTDSERRPRDQRSVRAVA